MEVKYYVGAGWRWLLVTEKEFYRHQKISLTHNRKEYILAEIPGKICFHIKMKI
jgi:hypothetical protein